MEASGALRLNGRRYAKPGNILDDDRYMCSRIASLSEIHQAPVRTFAKNRKGGKYIHTELHTGTGGSKSVLSQLKCSANSTPTSQPRTHGSRPRAALSLRPPEA